MALLRVIGEAPRGLVQAASATNLPTSTAARLLATLEDCGALTRDDLGVFHPGPMLQGIGVGHDAGGLPSLQRLADIAAPHMRALVAEVDEAVSLGIPSGDDLVTVAQVDAPKPVRAEDWTGSRWPLAAGGGGFVMLATWTADEVDDVLSRPVLPLTADTVTRLGEQRARIARARRSGVAWSHGEYVEDLSSVAVAITDATGRGIASLQVYGPSYRFPPHDGTQAIVIALRAAAERIAAALRGAERPAVRRWSA